MIRIGVIGLGYWGPNLVRNFSAVPDCKIAMVSDLRTERLDAIKKSYPWIEVTTSADDIFNSDIDAVAIATPVFTHYELAKKALTSGKHVLIEKPMADTVEHAEALIKLANEKGKTLMVDHTFLYTGAVKKIKELVDSGAIGTLKYFDSTRVNLGLIQKDVNVLWDLAPHDISILNYIVGEKPVSVQASGTSHIHNDVENIAYLTVKYNSGLIAHFHCSWSSPVKIRTILIGGDRQMVVFDDMNPAEKIKVYNTGHTVRTDEEKHNVMIDYRTGDIFVPKLDTKEALLGVVSDFANSIKTGDKPVSSYESGLWSVKILEAAQRSIKNGQIEPIL